jgi:hypothetical protein
MWRGSSCQVWYAKAWKMWPWALILQNNPHSKTRDLIILCHVNSPPLLVQNWLTQDTKEIPKLKILRQWLKSRERDKKNQNLENLIEWQRRQVEKTRRSKKSRLKSRDFEWMEKNGGSEARNSSLEILIEREERSYSWEGIKNLKTKIFYRLWFERKKNGVEKTEKIEVRRKTKLGLKRHKTSVKTQI